VKSMKAPKVKLEYSAYEGNATCLCSGNYSVE
jgi:hypothetical protein